MGDLAEEIEQMQAEINAFDDKLDALDANGDDGRKDEEPAKKSIFSRLGSSGDVVRKSSTGEDIQSDGEDGDENSPTKRRKSSVKSAVVDTSRRRESDISKDDIRRAQLGNEAGKRRASRMFKNLLGTLRTFDEKTKSESVSSKRAEIDRKVEERVAADRRKIIEEKKQLLIKKREKEKMLELLEAKKDFSDLRAGWEEHLHEQSKYIRTLSKPQIYWKPRIMDADAKELQQKTKQKITDLLDESKAEWDNYRSQLTTEIKDIKDRHQFKDIDLRIDGESKPSGGGRPPIGRLVITKSVKNDQRIVQPKNINGRTEERKSAPTTPEENGSRKTKEERKQKEKERRKEIEIARKRRHKSDSESDSDEYQERPRKLVVKKDKTDEKIITKDVRRVAPKEEPKQDTNILPSTTRRISLKTTKRPELNLDEKPKRRRMTKKSESQNTSSDKRASSNSSSSSSNSSESDSCNTRTPSGKSG